MITIRINTDNAAFEDENFELETARILRELAEKFENGMNPSGERDINGNRVCEIEYDS